MAIFYRFKYRIIEQERVRGAAEEKSFLLKQKKEDSSLLDVKG